MEQLNQLFIEAGTLMLAGMVFVFAFLGILVVIINMFLAPLAEKFPDAVESSNTRPTINSNKPSDHGVSAPIVAAISAAVSQYRQQQKNK